jgi:hypothetical protein
MKERTLGFARVRKAYHLRSQTHPEQTQLLRRRLQEYDADLHVLGLDDHELDRDPRLASPWLGALVAMQLVLVFLLLPPILLVGYVINLPSAGLLVLACKHMAKDVKDEATIKLLGGAVLFPLTWFGAGIAVANVLDWLVTTFPNYPATPLAAGVTTALLGALGGAVALRYLRLARQTLRAARVRLTRRKRRTAITRLRGERAAIFDSMRELVADAPLPGVVASDGRIVG